MIGLRLGGDLLMQKELPSSKSSKKTQMVNLQVVIYHQVNQTPTQELG